MLNKTSESLQEPVQITAEARGRTGEGEQPGSGAGSSPAPSGSGGSGGTGGTGNSSAPERGWGDSFTDPDYKHAPGGIQWLLEKRGVSDGSAAAGITTALMFVADKFNWTLELGQVQSGVSKFFDFMKGTGSRLLGVLGGAIGVLDVLSGIDNKDPFRIADGAIGGGLAVAALLATGTIVGAPAGVVLGGVALGWGLLGMMSGDVPVTKRIWDFGAGVVGGVRDLASGGRGRPGMGGR